MPGPCNSRRKKKAQAQKTKRKVPPPPSAPAPPARRASPPSSPSPHSSPSPAPSLSASRAVYRVHLPDDAFSHLSPDSSPSSYDSADSDDDARHTLTLIKPPCIEDPGSGPRVRDMRAFLDSRFAAPPSADDPLCAELAQPEVLEMLRTVLPDETAMILWYNRSRMNARVCPACQRLYMLGDVLSDHGRDPDALKPAAYEPRSPDLYREQALSGLCSPVCFILASYNHPGAIRATWGRVADEMSTAAWAQLGGPGAGADDKGLGMLLRMTRLDDLGLAQLCFPEGEFDEDEWAEDGELPVSARAEGLRPVDVEVEDEDEYADADADADTDTPEHSRAYTHSPAPATSYAARQPAFSRAVEVFPKYDEDALSPPAWEDELARSYAADSYGSEEEEWEEEEDERYVHRGRDTRVKPVGVYA